MDSVAQEALCSFVVVAASDNSILWTVLLRVPEWFDATAVLQLAWDAARSCFFRFSVYSCSPLD